MARCTPSCMKSQRRRPGRTPLPALLGKQRVPPQTSTGRFRLDRGDRPHRGLSLRGPQDQRAAVIGHPRRRRGGADAIGFAAHLHVAADFLPTTLIATRTGLGWMDPGVSPKPPPQRPSGPTADGRASHPSNRLCPRRRFWAGMHGPWCPGRRQEQRWPPRPAEAASRQTGHEWLSGRPAAI